MVGHHLPVIFPWSFGIEKKYAMDVEGYLQKIVELHDACERNMGVPCPKVGGKVVLDIL
jgi:hypothetical protein